MSISKAMKWAVKSDEEKTKIMMQMRIKEALRNHTGLTLSRIDEIAETNIESIDFDEFAKREMIVMTALRNEGHDVTTCMNIVEKAFSL